MKQEKQFNDILNECLDRLFHGETVEQCLRAYPAQAEKLEPLLRTARAARVASTIQPRSEFRARARYEFEAAVQDLAGRQERRSIFSWLARWRWQSGWAIALTVLMVFVIGGGATVAAASGSMPDSTLYPVKLATEKVQLTLARSDVTKAELNASFANRRAEEIGYMAAKGDAQEVKVIAARLNTNLMNITRITLNNAAGVEKAEADHTPGGESTLAAPRPLLSAAPATPAATTAAATGQSTGLAASPAITVPPSGSAPSLTAPPPAVTVNVPAPSPTSAFSVLAPVPPVAASRARPVTLTPEQEKLKKIIENNYQERQAKLQETLKKASPAVKTAIRQALAESQAEYEKEIDSLESAANAH